MEHKTHLNEGTKGDLPTVGWGLLHHESSNCTNSFIATCRYNTVFQATDVMVREAGSLGYSSYRTRECCCAGLFNSVDDIFPAQARLASIVCPRVRWCTVTFGTVLATHLLKGKKMQIACDIMVSWPSIFAMSPLPLLSFFHYFFLFFGVIKRASVHCFMYHIDRKTIITGQLNVDFKWFVNQCILFGLYATSHAYIQTALQIENVLFTSVIYWYITCLGAHPGL